MQNCHTMRLQSLHDAVEDQGNTHCRDEKANYSGDRIDAHWAEPVGKFAGICQTQVGDDHCRENGQTIATNEASSVDDCLIVEVMPRMVAIAPGPHMSGIASGTKAMLEP